MTLRELPFCWYFQYEAHPPQLQCSFLNYWLSEHRRLVLDYLQCFLPESRYRGKWGKLTAFDFIIDRYVWNSSLSWLQKWGTIRVFWERNCFEMLSCVRGRQQDLNSQGVSSFNNHFHYRQNLIGAHFSSSPLQQNPTLRTAPNHLLMSNLHLHCHNVWLLIINIFQHVPVPLGTCLTWRHHQSSPHLSVVNKLKCRLRELTVLAALGLQSKQNHIWTNKQQKRLENSCWELTKLQVKSALNLLWFTGGLECFGLYFSLFWRGYTPNLC